MVTSYGLFVGWIDGRQPQTGSPVDALADVEHLPKGCEATDIGQLIENLIRQRRAAMLQCRGCGASFTPGRMVGRLCPGCRLGPD